MIDSSHQTRFRNSDQLRLGQKRTSPTAPKLIL
jgi:hypothetical protein